MVDRTDDTATRVLRDEHKLILQVVGAFERTIGRSGTPLDGAAHDVVERCIAFFRLYADACHHGKEEDLLFPELEEHGLQGDDGPIAVMLAEHRQGRAYVGRMAASAAGARAGEESATRELRLAADGYIDLIRAHIDKEDNALFEIADDMVVGEECRRLCGEYAAACTRRFEGHTVEDLERLASDIAAG